MWESRGWVRFPRVICTASGLTRRILALLVAYCHMRNQQQQGDHLPCTLASPLMLHQFFPDRSKLSGDKPDLPVCANAFDCASAPSNLLGRERLCIGWQTAESRRASLLSDARLARILPIAR